MELKINEWSLAASAMVAPDEFKEFKSTFDWLRRSLFNLDAVKAGRWSKGDIEAATTVETQSYTSNELKNYRIKCLEEDVEKASDLVVKKFNKLNRKYYEQTGTYICPFVENRDVLLRKKLINLASVE